MGTETIRALLEHDHERLEALLDEALRRDPIDLIAFHAFRGGLLRHIGMEEKILLPFARGLRGGEALPGAKQMRLDHAAIASLLVPTPTHAVVARLRALLAAHNEIEEGEAGVYAQCDALAGAGRESLLARLRAAPPVKLAAYQDVPRAFASIERLLRAAGRA